MRNLLKYHAYKYSNINTYPVVHFKELVPVVPCRFSFPVVHFKVHDFFFAIFQLLLLKLLYFILLTGIFLDKKLYYPI